MRINFHKKASNIASIVRLDKVTARTATADGTGNGVIGITDEIINLTGITGQAAYLAMLPDPATCPFNKEYIVIGLAFPSTLDTLGTDCTINGSADPVKIFVGDAYLVKKISNTAWVVIGHTSDATS